MQQMSNQSGGASPHGNDGCGPQRRIPLPLLGETARSPRVVSRGRWRAFVLLGVHILIAAHIAHAMSGRRTLSPVEPSEAMYTLELGKLNAGSVFLLVALLGTLVFGRFFCGWACHLVALQDLCAWLMRRIGIKPRPFRSRIMVWIPVAVAFYMFAWPTLVRSWYPASSQHPGFSVQFLTSDFWATFPGLVMSILTFSVCGFATVYFLGSKGFCTYGCPYGALFGVVDRLSPARIVVSDACTGCGQCTINCTSNVRVHEEVKLHGMVVDSACMKCLDCVSACPTEALSYQFASPPALYKKPPRPARKVYDLSLMQECVFTALAAAATLAFRGLYDGPPLLLSVALGVLTAYLAWKLYSLASAANVTIQTWTLKASGHFRFSGLCFAFTASAWLAFTIHSGFVQWHRARGIYYLERTGITWVQIRSGAHVETRTPAEQEVEEKAHESLYIADRWGIFGVSEVKLGLAWIAILRDNPLEAEAKLRAATAIYPLSSHYHRFLAEFLLLHAHHKEAGEEYELVLELGPSTPEDFFQLGNTLAVTGRLDDAVTRFRQAVSLSPAFSEAQYNLGAALRRQGRSEEAVRSLTAAYRLSPRDPQVLNELSLALAESGSASLIHDVLNAAEPSERDRLLSDPRIRALLDSKSKRIK